MPGFQAFFRFFVSFFFAKLATSRIRVKLHIYIYTSNPDNEGIPQPHPLLQTTLHLMYKFTPDAHAQNRHGTHPHKQNSTFTQQKMTQGK